MLSGQQKYIKMIASNETIQWKYCFLLVRTILIILLLSRIFGGHFPKTGINKYGNKEFGYR
jgi:hypothetical protein